MPRKIQVPATKEERLAKVMMSNAEYFRVVVRTFQLQQDVDRMMLVIATRLPYGSFSRVITQLEQGGYIRRIPGMRRTYDTKALRESNPDLANVRLSYGTNRYCKPQVYKVTPLFKSEFLPAWSAFLEEFPVSRRQRDRQLPLFE